MPSPYIWCGASLHNQISLVEISRRCIHPWLRLIPESKDTERGRFRARSLISTNERPPYIFCLLASHWLLRAYKCESQPHIYLYCVPIFKESTPVNYHHPTPSILPPAGEIPSEDIILKTQQKIEPSYTQSRYFSSFRF